MSKKAREVSCPFCWVTTEIKVPMVFDVRTGLWQCVRGNHTAANLDDDDEEAIRADLMRMYDERAEDERARHAARKYIKALAGPVKRTGGTKSGRKPKKPKGWIIERPGTLA